MLPSAVLVENSWCRKCTKRWYNRLLRPRVTTVREVLTGSSGRKLKTVHPRSFYMFSAVRKGNAPRADCHSRSTCKKGNGHTARIVRKQMTGCEWLVYVEPSTHQHEPFPLLDVEYCQGHMQGLSFQNYSAVRGVRGYTPIGQSHNQGIVFRLRSSIAELSFSKQRGSLKPGSSREASIKGIVRRKLGYLSRNHHSDP